MKLPTNIAGVNFKKISMAENIWIFDTEVCSKGSYSYQRFGEWLGTETNGISREGIVTKLYDSTTSRH